MSQTIPFFISIPHSGEKIPPQTPWLDHLPEQILMADVDRYVDILYRPSIDQLKLPFQSTAWHRYAVDLNRIPDDIDVDAVAGAVKKSGTHSDGFHWVMTKNEDRIMPQPMSWISHLELSELIYEPFHAGIRNHYKKFKEQGCENVFQLDVHSMPSVGTRLHRDPGEIRADIVISDCKGSSCHPHFRDLVISAYVTSGFKVAYNWPYLGGRVTEQYGQPKLGQQVLQVELNRSLYMDEKTKQILPSHVDVQSKILKALTYVKSELPKIQF